MMLIKEIKKSELFFAPFKIILMVACGLLYMFFFSGFSCDLLPNTLCISNSYRIAFIFHSINDWSFAQLSPEVCLFAIVPLALIIIGFVMVVGAMSDNFIIRDCFYALSVWLMANFICDLLTFNDEVRAGLYSWLKFDWIETILDWLKNILVNVDMGIDDTTKLVIMYSILVVWMFVISFLIARIIIIDQFEDFWAYSFDGIESIFYNIKVFFLEFGYCLVSFAIGVACVAVVCSVIWVFIIFIIVSAFSSKRHYLKDEDGNVYYYDD